MIWKNRNPRTLSIKLLETLQEGKKRLGSEARQRTAAFVQSQLTGNGMFMDKNGRDDLYYTSFGLMLAWVLNLNINTNRTVQWIENQNGNLSDLVNRAAFIRSLMLCKLLKSGKIYFPLSRLFQKGQTLPVFTTYPHGDRLSPYSQFLLLSLKEDMGIKTENHREILTSLATYQVENGGFGNIKGCRQASTNATVAALAIHGQLCGYRVTDDVDYLCSLQDESGGFLANGSAPVPDLLSTATALFMLKCYGVVPRINADSFIDAHWLSSGGFCATLMDESSDVEYTFYGLLALGAMPAEWSG